MKICYNNYSKKRKDKKMNTYSIKFFMGNKGWDKRGMRVIAKNSTEAIELAKIRKKIPKSEKVLVRWRYC